MGTTTDETVTFTVPRVSTAPGSAAETQQKKGLIIQVVPVPFKVSDTPRKDCVPGAEESSILDGLIKVNGGKPTKKPYIVTTQTGIDFKPKTLTFQVKVTNHTEKVMKLDGAYLRLNINSEEVMLSDYDLKKFHDAVLLPNDSKSFHVAGPDWGHNPDDAIVTFTATQIPNEYSASGQLLDTATFTWTFSAKLESKQAQSQKTVENLMLDPTEAASLYCHPGAPR
jgi:hypothetical protein